MNAFIQCTPLVEGRAATTLVRSCCPTRAPMTMAKKRSGKSKSRGSTSQPSKAVKPSNASQPQSQSQSQSPSQDETRRGSPSSSSSDPEPFVPRGPTMRAEYERKGLIEPSVPADGGSLPEFVANRMIRRIVAFTGGPLFLLFGFFAVYFVLKYRYDITVLPGVVAFSTLGAVGLATAGITYGILSSSWDEEDGSLLGFEEAKTNFLRARDALTGARQRELKEDELDEIDQLAEDIEREEAEKKTKEVKMAKEKKKEDVDADVEGTTGDS